MKNAIYNFQCPSCDYQYISEHLLSTHLLFVHGIFKQNCQNYQVVDKILSNDRKRARFEVLKRLMFGKRFMTESKSNLILSERKTDQPQKIPQAEGLEYVQLDYELHHKISEGSLKYIRENKPKMCLYKPTLELKKHNQLLQTLRHYGRVNWDNGMQVAAATSRTLARIQYYYKCYAHEPFIGTQSYGMCSYMQGPVTKLEDLDLEAMKAHRKEKHPHLGRYD